MKIYLIYAIMKDYNQSNCFGQYDIFRNGNVANSLTYVLWGFTDKKSIRNKFFKERPVKNRYYEKVVEMEESEYSLFMIDYFRFELLPIAFDLRQNIGMRSGFLNIPDKMSLLRKSSIPKGEEEFYAIRISNKYEYDFVLHNIGEICMEYKLQFFEENKDLLPIDSNIFTDPLRLFLDKYNYMGDMFAYHPYIKKYLNKDSPLYKRFQNWLKIERSMKNDGFFIDEYSFIQVYFITFKDMIV